MTVRIALVGCGTVARVTHLPAFRSGGDADVVAFASRSLASAEAARDDWGSGDVTTDWASLVTRDDIDAVDVCVPNALHAEVAATALAAGKHVLVEKPMTTTLDDADALLGLAGDRVLAVAFDARCNPLLVELRRRLASIGRIEHVEATLGHGGPQLWAPDADWFRDPELSGGGCLIDLGSHAVDAVAWCAGPIASVVAARLDGPVDEDAEVDLVCTSGATARVSVSWRLPSPTFSFGVKGSGGTVDIVDGQLRQDGLAVDVPPVELASSAGAFARAVATGTATPADGADGRAAVAAVLAAHEAARTESRVDLA